MDEDRRHKEVATNTGFLICLIGGLFGVHRFYLGQTKLGILYACTLGVFGIGWLADLIRISQILNDYNSRYKGKRLAEAYILGASPLGIFGVHHYYIGSNRLGVIYTCTFGLLGVGWIADLIRMPKIVRELDLYVSKKTVDSAYIMAIPPLGLFGIYHFFLGNYRIGLFQMCTIGMFGFGWIIDLLYMKDLVSDANNDVTYDRRVITAYKLCYSPLGLFGAHHFYLREHYMGRIYLSTAGLVGAGWIFDMFRFPVLYERYVTCDKYKYLDEAYVYWSPFGVVGLHYLYLGNVKWFFIYLFTGGLLTFGWIYDGFRMPHLIKRYNEEVCESDEAPLTIRSSALCKSLKDLIVSEKKFQELQNDTAFRARNSTMLTECC